jgi:hypothetical protein
MLVIGVMPEPFLAPSRPALHDTLALYQERVAAPPAPAVVLREAAPVAVAAGVAEPTSVLHEVSR